jgi:hypothetical protein
LTASAFRRRFAAALAVATVSAAAVVFTANSASARDVSPAVKRACANDYFAHCSMHPVGTPAVRKCMRAVGPRLSKPCIGALAAAGEVTKSDRKRYKTASTNKSRRN